MQEELEVRLEESNLPAPEWAKFNGKPDSAESIETESDYVKAVAYGSGHVKLALEGTGEGT